MALAQVKSDTYKVVCNCLNPAGSAVMLESYYFRSRSKSCCYLILGVFFAFIRDNL
jgi:hypothetical protein